MDAIKIKKALAVTWFHTRTFLRGFVRIVGSTLVAGAAAGSVYGFMVISSETGYAAVGDFVSSCALMVIALVGTYAAGQRGRCYKKGRFAKEAK